MEEIRDSELGPKGEEVKIEVVLRRTRSPLRYTADTVILRFAPTQRLENAELRKGDRVIDTEPGWALHSLRAVGGNMTVEIEGPGDRREGPFEADWVKMQYPSATQTTIGSTLPSGESRWYVVEVFNDDVRVWTRRVEER